MDKTVGRMHEIYATMVKNWPEELLSIFQDLPGEFCPTTFASGEETK